MGFLAGSETAVIGGFTTVANTFGAGLLGTFRPAFIIGFTIWITLIAYEVAFGKAEDGFTYLFTKIGKIFLIGVLALYGWPELAELLGGVRDGFVGATTISTILNTNLLYPMQATFDALIIWFTDTIGQYGITDIVEIIKTTFTFFILFICYALMAIAVSIFAVVALAMYLVANSIFVLLLALGPFFLLCLAFPFLQRFFETFIGNVMTSILAMAFIVLMIFFVANLFGLTNIQSVIPSAIDPTTIQSETKSLSILFASKFATALLIIYLTYKVFDLAAALGGGLNTGNNMVGGVRNIMRDLQQNSGGGARGASSTVNQISQGSTGGGASSAGSARAARANSTFTGMAMGAASKPVGAIGSSAIAGAGNVARIASYGAGRVAGAMGRFAYNRHAQVSNRTKNSG
jgi:type IV secretion system protein VirB6